MEKRRKLEKDQKRDVLDSLAAEKAQAIVSYMSRSKWHISKVVIVDYNEKTITVEIPSRNSRHPINIKAEQPVGISSKQGFNKVVFESKVIGFEPSSNPESGGKIVLSSPEKIEFLQRRNFFRVSVPESLNVNVQIWNRVFNSGRTEIHNGSYIQGELMDVSAGGLQLSVEKRYSGNFKCGQFIGLQFTPKPYEKPLILEAQVRRISPTEDGSCLCVGTQLIGLEASQEGREKLLRLCDIVEDYHQMNKLHSSSAVVL